jgi:hypothetical protein
MEIWDRRRHRELFELASDGAVVLTLERLGGSGSDFDLSNRGEANNAVRRATTPTV